MIDGRSMSLALVVSSLQRIGRQMRGREISTSITGGLWSGRRSVSWAGGFTAKRACDRIDSVYEASSTVSDINKALIRD